MYDENSLEKNLKYVVVYQCSPIIKEYDNHKTTTNIHLEIDVKLTENSFVFKDVYIEYEYEEYKIEKGKEILTNKFKSYLGSRKLYSVLYIEHKTKTVRYYTKSRDMMAELLKNKFNNDKTYLVKTKEILYLLLDNEKYIVDLYMKSKSNEMDFMFVEFIRTLFMVYHQSADRNADKLKMINIGENFMIKRYKNCIDNVFLNEIKTAQALIHLRLGVKSLSYYNSSIRYLFTNIIKSIKLVEEERVFRFKHYKLFIEENIGRGNAKFIRKLDDEKLYDMIWKFNEAIENPKNELAVLEKKKIIKGKLNETEEKLFVDLCTGIEKKVIEHYDYLKSQNDFDHDMYLYKSTVQYNASKYYNGLAYETKYETLGEYERFLEVCPYKYDFDPDSMLDKINIWIHDLDTKQKYYINTMSSEKSPKYDCVFVEQRDLKNEYYKAFLSLILYTIEKLETNPVGIGLDYLRKLIEYSEILSEYLLGLMKYSGTIQIFRTREVRNMGLGKILLGEDYLFLSKEELFHELNKINQKFMQENQMQDKINQKFVQENQMQDNQSVEMMEVYRKIRGLFWYTDFSVWDMERFEKLFRDVNFYENNKLLVFSKKCMKDLSQILFLRQLLKEKLSYIHNRIEEKEIMEKLIFLEKDLLGYSRNACTGILSDANEAIMIDLVDSFAIKCTELELEYRATYEALKQEEKAGIPKVHFAILNKRKVEKVNNENLHEKGLHSNKEDMACKLRCISEKLVVELEKNIK